MNKIKALTFDTGGTILDWHSGFRDALKIVGDKYNYKKVYNLPHIDRDILLAVLLIDNKANHEYFFHKYKISKKIQIYLEKISLKSFDPFPLKYTCFILESLLSFLKIMYSSLFKSFKIVFDENLLIKKPFNNDRGFDKFNPDPSKSWAPYKVFNIGNSDPVPLMEYVSALEEVLGTKANIEFLPMQPGDVEATFADTGLLESYVGFKPKTKIKDGIKKFIEWYKVFYKIK